MTERDVKRMLETAAKSSEMPGWNDRLQWLVEATLAGCGGGLELEDTFLDDVAAGKGSPDFQKTLQSIPNSKKFRKQVMK